jgi:hypothetical protein
MANEKRERQRANRESKRAEQARQHVKQQRIDVLKRYGMYTIVFSIALIALKVFFG